MTVRYILKRNAGETDMALEGFIMLRYTALLLDGNASYDTLPSYTCEH
jgi:hypothetical protein